MANKAKGFLTIHKENADFNQYWYSTQTISFLAEQAGGLASDGFGRIMEILPTELHQRVPFFCGSKNMVKKAEEFMAKYV